MLLFSLTLGVVLVLWLPVETRRGDLGSRVPARRVRGNGGSISLSENGSTEIGWFAVECLTRPGFWEFSEECEPREYRALEMFCTASES